MLYTIHTFNVFFMTSTQRQRYTRYIEQGTRDTTKGKNMNDTIKKRVPVVDDHPKVLRFVDIDLRLRGYEVMTTVSGEEALALVKTCKPDILLLDIIMPGIDGFEVLKRLRSFTRLPVIAFSASLENHEDAMRLGANDFVAKPLEPVDLERRIKTILGG
jgi:two-component system, OmpR family, KDP operon response regulator KdpE